MGTAAEPAAPTGVHHPPHRAAWFAGVGICIVGSAGYALLVTVAAVAPGPNHTEAMSFARAATITLIVVGLVIAAGVWTVRRRAEDLVELRTEIHSVTSRLDDWEKNHQKRTAQLEAMSLRVDQLSSRLGWLIQQLAPDRLNDSRPQSQQRSGSRRHSNKRKPAAEPAAAAAEPVTAAEALDELWQQDVAEAFRLGRQLKEPPPRRST